MGISRHGVQGAEAVDTDGARDNQGVRGLAALAERLVGALRRHAASCPERAIVGVVEEVREFGVGEQHDDMTMIVAKCR